MQFDPDIPFVSSPNFSSRRGLETTGTLLHYTAGGRASGSVRWLCNPAARASAHFVFARSGRNTQLVDLAMKAWHAGISESDYMGEMTSDVSRFTIGVELANHGCLQRDGDRFLYEIGRELRPYHGPEPVKATLLYDNGPRVPGWWEPFADDQLDALQAFLRKIANKLGAHVAHNLIGHDEVAMPLGRKRDPGPLFPWDRFSRATKRRVRRAA